MARASTRPCKAQGEASWLSRKLFLWAYEMVRRGVRRPLEEADVPAAPRCVQTGSGFLTVAEELWRVEQARYTAAGEDGPRLISGVIWPLSRERFVRGALCSATSGVLTACVRPVLLKYAVEALLVRNASTLSACLQGLGLAVCMWCFSWSLNYGAFVFEEAANRGSLAMLHLVSTKGTHVRCGAGHEGNETNLQAPHPARWSRAPQ